MIQEPFGLALEAECQLPVDNSDGNLLDVYRPDFSVENKES
jgi:hypothetical protein